ncbi:thiamine diphosphokinase [[Clostridium] polysaccharolyticum]|uniref:Thiamine diphosphokinase n=1 Tax=[Clostridium] polysaccharolyticum TaxID=29364 RepID=A0A1H9Y0S9_9FIRM|nr:thiamine diphosphokinase [[Clostridium] polysaccharolyticum]SES62341.1 thiamine pyrophosphokinase [[Clostridium] polysaccharolyticum]
MQNNSRHTEENKAGQLAFGKCKNVCILSGGDVNHEFLLEFLQEEPCEQMICVDGGLAHAYALGLKVDYIVGDFDTIDVKVLEYYKKHSKVPIREFQPEKDYTDTDIALDMALSLKPKIIYILGGIGSRMDHTLGNIHILKKALCSQAKTFLLNEHNRISMADHSFAVERSKAFGDYISFLPFTETVKNLTLKGFKYPLEHCTMVNGESLGISNEIVNETAYVEFQEGILLMIEARD